MKHNIFLAGILSLVFGMMLGGCDNSSSPASDHTAPGDPTGTHTITYEVTGTGAAASRIDIRTTSVKNEIRIEESENFNDVSLPWSKTISVASDKGSTVTAYIAVWWHTTSPSKQTITVNIYNDGVLLKSATSISETGGVCQAVGGIGY